MSIVSDLSVCMISCLYPYPSRGLSPGIERLAEGVANALVRKGIEVNIITSRALGQLREGTTPAGANIFPVHSLRDYPRTGLLAMNHVSFSSSVFLKRRRQIEEADVIQVFAGYLFPFALLEGRLPPLASYFPHLDVPRSWRDFTWLFEANLIMKRLYSKSDVVLAGVPKGSKGFRDLTDFFNVPSGKIRLVYEGVDQRVFKRDVDSAWVKDKFGGSIILYVGSSDPRKGVIHLIRAMKKVAEARRDAKLVLVGHVGESHVIQLREAVRSLGLENHVVFEGFVPENRLPSYYAAADVFAFPSLNDGYPQVCLEAMACGCPVVATRLDTISEIVGDGGLLTNPGDQAQISDAIVSLLEDSSLRRSLSKLGEARVLSKFTWDKATDAYLDVYREMLNAAN